MSQLCRLPSELQARHKYVKGLGNVMYKLLTSVGWEHKTECVCAHGLAQQSHVALQQCGPPMCSGTVDPTQRQSYTTDKKKWGRKRKEDWINQTRRKTKATGQWGPKCRLASTRREGGKEKRKSRIYQRKVLFLFLDSWVSYYGIRFNQCPPRNVEQRAGGNGWKSLGDDVGRV